MCSHKGKNTKILYLTVFYLLSFVDATPIASAPAPNTHAISFVSERKTNDKYAEINDFDFGSFDEATRNENYSSMNGALEQFFGQLLSLPKQNETKYGHQKFAKLQITDDLLNSEENTLESTNIVFGNTEQLESNKNSNDTNISSNAYHRFKQSIPALKPVKDLLNTVREGGFNHSTHLNKSRHHLVRPGEVGGMGAEGESSAIETEEDREMASHSAGFNVLDFLGTIGRMIWGFIMNLFAASSNGSIGGSV